MLYSVDFRARCWFSLAALRLTSCRLVNNCWQSNIQSNGNLDQRYVVIYEIHLWNLVWKLKIDVHYPFISIQTIQNFNHLLLYSVVDLEFIRRFTKLGIYLLWQLVKLGKLKSWRTVLVNIIKHDIYTCTSSFLYQWTGA